MKIVDVICSKGVTGFYFDDQLALRQGAKSDGLFYKGEAATEGFSAVRQAGESISVQLILDDGQIAFGDCAAVQYSGAGGRDPLFLADDYIDFIEKDLAKKFVGKELKNFFELADTLEEEIDGKKMHTAIRYGFSQALLDAVAKSQKKLMAEVIADELGQKVEEDEITIFAQTGDSRYENADKMIIKAVPAMPHGLFNNVEEKLGNKGEKLLEYIKWLKNRIDEKKTSDDYNPLIHIDVYGTIGIAFDNNIDIIVAYLKTLEEASKPYQLAIEGVADLGSREKQVDFMAEIRKVLDDKNVNVIMVIDEWCNTFEDVKLFCDKKAGHMIQIKTPDLGGVQNTARAVKYCKDKGLLAYQGGTCNETDRSSQVCVHVAMGSGADQILAKPGMGVDEGVMIVRNEMNRILRFLKYKKEK